MNTIAQTNKKDVVICYRIYPKISKSPVIFSDDKFQLSELCIKSFRDSLVGLNFRMRVLLDNCPKEYEELFKKHFDAGILELVNLPGVGNHATFLKQIDYLLSQDESEYVYFAEDDYFYLANTFQEMIEFMKSRNDVDFVSPFDHLDMYTIPLHDYKSQISFSNKRHWRTAGMTCLTFLATKTSLARHQRAFKSYARNNSDAAIWASVTKTKIFNPFNFLYKTFVSRVEFLVLGCAWFYTPFQNIFAPKSKLWTPMPSIALHLESKTIAPTIDWKKQFDMYLK